jgi:hypothetical protein
MEEELSDISAGAALQRVVEAVNDTAGPDGLVPTLLVFGASPPSSQSPTIAQCTAAVKKAITAI